MPYGKFLEVIYTSSSILREKSKEFAQNIVFLCRDMRRRHVENILVNQLLRCGTSVGANVYEAQYAQSKKDFISKLEIALKECNESVYRLELLRDTNCISISQFTCLEKRCIELRRMLVSSVTTIKAKETDT